MKFAFFFVISVLLALPSLRAAEEATPEAIAKRQLEAMRALDWARVASYTHPKALSQMKALFLPIAAAAAAQKENAAASGMMRALFGGKSADALTAEKPAEFFQTILNGLGSVVPEFNPAMQGMQAEVLGHVDDGEEIAHVVYRLTRLVGDNSVTKIAVTSVERDGPAWKALLNSDLENAARLISARLQPR